MARDDTAGVSAPGHYVSARACRMMMKGRTHRLVPHDVSAVYFRVWFARGVRVKLPKDFRLSGGWLRYVMRAFLPDASRKSAILTNPPMVD